MSEFSETENTGPTIRDRRRIDPETYQVREPQAAAPGPGAPSGPSDLEETAAGTAAAEEIAGLKTQLGERTADLQRLQAEYVNYKRRVDRDRDVARKGGIEAVLKDLMSVLDHIGSAREHGEVTGGFKAVADEIERVTARHGLESYGTAGEPFDPHIHEALMHAHADGIDGPTCVQILQPGYRIGERILRPARVAVAEPDPDAPAAQAESQEAPNAPTADDEQ
ncbi:GrpE protein [Microlunatus phosphovorus NM-1]|uniref:Protein GrpE n=1 Tax=Microlunatus phosphovorus (strain ATCC 700054 / DSM 10555 / JCM 9379 / NBRC 101784 / NCIMB 13414 / VKM Ac-1990 / NM-1) TaxID=1032480 RepID=F5XKT9_MICPN|nr:nucleotide exchange factor GrpE [Microlunatus phosphovorus]BAK33627.1 GrpE protein [Microlunatus phosphovorus NM-1]